MIVAVVVTVLGTSWAGDIVTREVIVLVPRGTVTVAPGIVTV